MVPVLPLLTPSGWLANPSADMARFAVRVEHRPSRLRSLAALSGPLSSLGIAPFAKGTDVTKSTPLTAQRRWNFRLPAEFGIRDFTPELEDLVRESGITAGLAVVALVGSTGAVTTIEYESGALEDLRVALDRMAPVEADYAHNARWGDGNGFSHVRSALLKTSIAVPVVDGRLQLGTWQQVVVLNLDNRGRDREVVATVVGC